MLCCGADGARHDDPLDAPVIDHDGAHVQLSREEFQCVTKKEAKEAYLLPEGTIAVLKFIERDNPHHSSWTKVQSVVPKWPRDALNKFRRNYGVGFAQLWQRQLCIELRVMQALRHYGTL